MKEDSEMRWHLDAWDPLAGRAFVCERKRDGGDAPDLDQPVFFVAPPFFDVERLTSRAPGLAATRGFFQLGLFIDGREIGFATLDDAVAFVRRGFNSPGSDPSPASPITDPDGPKGGGFTLLPDIPKESGSQAFDESLAALTISFAKASGDLKLGTRASLFMWSLGGISSSDVEHVLITAATALTAELLRRCPKGGTPDDLIEWLGSARRLGRYLVQLDVWDGVARRFDKPLSIRQPEIDAFVRHFNIRWPIREPETLLHLLFWPYDWPFRFGGVPFFVPVATNSSSEAYDDLASLPLPSAICSAYPQVAGKHPTLLTLISTWFAHPVSVHRSVEHIDRALLLFGAACTVSDRSGSSGMRHPLFAMRSSPKLKDAFFERLGRDSENWLSAQLPDRAFSPQLENTLASLWEIPSRIRAAGPASVREASAIDELDDEQADILRAELGDLIDVPSGPDFAL